VQDPPAHRAEQRLADEQRQPDGKQEADRDQRSDRNAGEGNDALDLVHHVGELRLGEVDVGADQVGDGRLGVPELPAQPGRRSAVGGSVGGRRP
jgi:hypothetical protein